MSSTDRLHVFCVENHIYSSPNSTTIPSIPPSAPFLSQAMDPRDASTIRWADRRYPGFPFIPLSPRFDMGPFRCLHPPRDVFPIKGSGSSWQLAPATAKAFRVLENDLHLITRALRTDSVPMLISPSGHALFPMPRKYRYEAVHDTYEGASASALKSRDAFLPLMGWCSFLISHFHERDPDSNVGVFQWEKLLNQAKFSLDYIQIIKASELADFSVSYPRAGVFIEHNDSHFQHYVGKATKCNVPVWIHWGDVSYGKPVHFGILGQYFPNDVQVAAARQGVNEPAGHPAQGKMNVDHPVVETVGHVDKFPEPEKHSRQKRGELPRDFFDRMDKIRAEAIETEDVAAKMKRGSREKAQEGHPAPGLNSRAPKVFEWEADVVTGFLLRKAITRSYAQDMWDFYSQRQRRYDSIHHEWDLCKELDPDPPITIVAKAYEDSDSEDEFYYNPPKPPVSPVPPDAIRSPIAAAVSCPLSSPAGHDDVPSPPSLVTPALRDHTSSHSCEPMRLPPSIQNDEDMDSSVPHPLDLHPAPSTCHDTSSSINSGTSSSSYMPLHLVTQPHHDLMPSVPTRESTPLPPTIPQTTFATQSDGTDGVVSPSVLSSPAVAPAPHNPVSVVTDSCGTD
jgi:hypothetical protein